MPLFEYQCAKCQDRFEELVSSSNSEEVVVCPNCGSKKTSRMLSAFAVGGSNKGSATSGVSSANGGGCGPRGFS